MYTSIKEKLAQAKKEGSYFSRCEYRVTCSIQDQVITKHIQRIIHLRSFDSSYTLPNLLVLNRAGLSTVPRYLVLHSVTDKFGKPFDYTVDPYSEPRDLDSFCGYSSQCKVKLREPLNLSDTQDTTLAVSYTTRVPLSDNIYTCRSSVPCKDFSVDISLVDTPDYKLNAVAFGFWDSAPYARINTKENNIRVSFDNWFFTKDGVSIVFSPNLKPPATAEETLH